MTAWYQIHLNKDFHPHPRSLLERASRLIDLIAILCFVYIDMLTIGPRHQDSEAHSLAAFR